MVYLVLLESLGQKEYLMMMMINVWFLLQLFIGSLAVASLQRKSLLGCIFSSSI